MARPVFWRSGAAAEVAPRISHLDLDKPLVEAARRDPARFDALYRRDPRPGGSYADYELGAPPPPPDAPAPGLDPALRRRDVDRGDRRRPRPLGRRRPRPDPPRAPERRPRSGRMTLLGRDVGEIEALVTDRYLDSLLAGRASLVSSEPLD